MFMKIKKKIFIKLMQEFIMIEYNEDDVMCPVCGNPLVEEEGLTVCYYCGWSEDILEE